MKSIRVLCSLGIILLVGGFSPSVSCAGKALSDREILQLVNTLANGDGSVHLRDLRVTRGNRGELKLKISADIGICWGTEQFAKQYAKKTLHALFHSGLPLSHVILEVLDRDESLLIVALGKNQARRLNWDDEQPLDRFYEGMRSRMTYKGDPTDYCWLIEKTPRQAR